MTLARATDERCGAEAVEDIDQHDLATVSVDDLVADDLVAGIVAALHQHARPDLRDQLDRRVFLEDDDEIDRLQRRQHFGARALVLNRTPLALQPFHRRIAVQSDHQPVTGATRPGQYLDLAGMPDIETAVGETDPQALLAPVRKLTLEVAACRDDLFLGREEAIRQNLSPQFR